MMHRHFVRTLVACSVLAGAAAAFAQEQRPTLGEMAKREEDRRKAIAKPAKVLTNTDLRPAPVSEAANDPAAPGKDSTPPSTAVQKDATATSADAKGTGDQDKTKDKPTDQDETHWRERMAAARSKLDHDKAVLDGLRSQVNFLNGAVLAQDDPARKQQLSNQRFKVQHELDLLQKDVQEDNKALIDLPEEARRAGVPPGWLR